jgi:hypothetical protein
MNLQPIATIFFGDGWTLGYSGNTLADWPAPSRDVWTVPIGGSNRPRSEQLFPQLYPGDSNAASTASPLDGGLFGVGT